MYSVDIEGDSFFEGDFVMNGLFLYLKTGSGVGVFLRCLTRKNRKNARTTERKNIPRRMPTRSGLIS